MASRGALAAVAGAELAAKSCRLRLDGLRKKRESIEADLIPAWERLESFRNDYFGQRVAELSAEFEAAVDVFRGLICRAFVLRRHGGAHGRPKYLVDWRMGNMCFFNPMAGDERSSFRGGIFADSVGKRWALDQHWERDTNAAEVDEAIRAIKDRLAPIGAVMAEIRPKQ